MEGSPQAAAAVQVAILPRVMERVRTPAIEAVVTAIAARRAAHPVALMI
jgi:hypothetical protein